MSAALTFPLMTAEQFFELPEPQGDYTWELHFGELVEVGRPKKEHYKLQRVIRDLLIKALGESRWLIDIEMAYGLSATYDARRADVGVCLNQRWDAIADDGYLIGSPDIVVQVKSRSNRDRRMEEDAVLHIAHRASAMWLVKPEQREVVVISAASRQVYGMGDSIPLPGSAAIAVNDIFPV